MTTDDDTSQSASTQHFNKVRLSRHQMRNIYNGVPGHEYDAVDARYVIASPIARGVQVDGRHWFHGPAPDNKQVRVVTSLTASATMLVAVVVTAYRCGD